MNDGSLKIVIGASADRSIETVFSNIEKRAQKASQSIGKSFSGAMGGGTGGSGGAGRGFDAAAASARKAERDIEREIAKQVKATANAEREMKREHDKAARDYLKTENEKTREIIRGIKEVEREQSKANRKAEQDEARIAKNSERNRDRFATRTSQRAVRFLVPNPIGAFGMASRIGGDLLRGAGIDTSFSGMAQRAVQAQSLSTQLSSQGWMRNQAGANGQHVAASVLESEARKNAMANGYTTEQALTSQTKFVDLTGNLDDARKAMPSILKLSSATGTDPEKMAEAWANVSRHMGDIPNKAEKVEGLMRLIAGQGRVGSIEIKDEAKDLGKIAAMADKYGGDRAASIGKLATLAQLGKAEGGAASSAQAATSIVSFTNTFSSAARLKAMMRPGMLKESDIFNMTGTGKGAVRSSIKDPFEIIKKVLDKTGGDITKFGNIFKSVMSQRATNALVSAYNSEGGHNMSAVDKKLGEFGSESALSKDAVDDASADRMKTSATQAVVFQEKLDEIGRSVEAELLPSLEKLAPYALQAAEGLSKLVTWAAGNPMTAVSAAIAAAIGRALLESTFRSSIESAIKGVLGSGASGAVGSAIGAAGVAAEGEVAGATALGAGAAGAAGVAVLPLTVAALTVLGAVTVGNMLVKHSDLEEKGAPLTDTPTNDGKPKITTALQDKRVVKSIDDLYGPNTDKDDVVNNGKNPQTAAFRAALKEQQEGKSKDNVIDHSALASAVTSGMRSGGPFQVYVANMPAGGGNGPFVPPNGRGPDPGAPPNLPSRWNQ